MEKLKDIYGRLITNAITLTVTNTAGLKFESAGLFRILSCVNHSCEPNIEVLSYRHNASIGMRTLRALSPADLLQISYIPVHLPLLERAHLLTQWCFSCRCPRCVRDIAAE